MRMLQVLGLATVLAIGAIGATGCGLAADDEVDGELGTAASKLLTVSPSSLGFGNVNVGCRVTHVFAVTNAGPGIATITGITSSSSVFTHGGLPGTIAVNATANLNITFFPAAQTAYSGTVTVTSTSSGVRNPDLVINVSGTGFPPGPC